MITEAVDQVRSDWKKWTAGPYRVLLQSEAYKMNVAEWEIGMHEWLAVEDVSDEMLQQFMDTVGGDFTDKADLIRAMGLECTTAGSTCDPISTRESSSKMHTPSWKQIKRPTSNG